MHHALPEALVARLRHQFPFTTFDQDDWTTFLSLLTTRKVPAGEVLFTRGDKGHCAYLVAEGRCSIYLANHLIRRCGIGDYFGELSLFGASHRTASVIADTPLVVLQLEGADLDDVTKVPPVLARKLYKGFARTATGYLGKNSFLYTNMEVLIVQDGGCAPGYNPVTAFLTEYLEKSGYRVFVAARGFRSLVSDTSEDYRCLVHDADRHKQLDHIPGVMHSAPLRNLRGAAFRSERYPEFRDEALQRIASQNMHKRNVKMVIGIGGNGTCAGIRSMSRFLSDDVQVFFIPVTIDSDIRGTECIGEYTGVEFGSEKIRCYMADARTHRRLYIVEMMGASGGYHALHELSMLSPVQ